MSLLDETIDTVIGTEPKRNWKDYFRNIDSILDLKDQHEVRIGKFQMGDEKYNLHTLYNSDGTILLRLKHSGNLRVSVEIRDSENNFLARTDSKMGLTEDLVWLENSKGDKILECKTSFDIPIWDKNKKTVARLNMRRFKNDFTLNIDDPHFNKIMILGFSLSLLIMQKWTIG